MKKISFWSWVLFVLWSINVLAAHPGEEETWIKLYKSPSLKGVTSLSVRVEKISALFLGCPYELGALGEGHVGEYDQMPLYREDAFDCQTFVETVLALAVAHDFPEFQQTINQIRYHKGQVSYVERNHFTCLDWNKNNQQAGFLKDITQNIHDLNGKSVSKVATALIDKAGWYHQKSIKDIKLKHANPTLQRKRLKSLQQAGNTVVPVLSTIPYIPLTALFDSKGHANAPLFQQIPNAAIIEIVRPNWDAMVGTPQNVSHLGFAIWAKNRLYFREASSKLGHVADVPLEDYLREYLKSPTIKGINVQILNHIISANRDGSIVR